MDRFDTENDQKACCTETQLQKLHHATGLKHFSGLASWSSWQLGSRFLHGLCDQHFPQCGVSRKWQSNSPWFYQFWSPYGGDQTLIDMEETSRKEGALNSCSLFWQDRNWSLVCSQPPHTYVLHRNFNHSKAAWRIVWIWSFTSRDYKEKKVLLPSQFVPKLTIILFVKCWHSVNSMHAMNYLLNLFVWAQKGLKFSEENPEVKVPYAGAEIRAITSRSRLGFCSQIAFLSWSYVKAAPPSEVCYSWKGAWHVPDFSYWHQK